ncbi:hypothetical protein FIBSPDRAFT_1036980 [Athelia psychrophila]|uniref:Uncharacterized protein n=1 Tax=Athelia psychrophila TaxID=1759441 RepID=A0A166V533_9AGAM|nr:hypothetical protein FIBSPDRAFT_1036980 [Fibularhizoctonia sp. CBS 109695]
MHAEKEDQAEAGRKKMKDMEVGSMVFVEAAVRASMSPARQRGTRCRSSRRLLTGYITAHTVVNPNDQPCINLDELLRSMIPAENNTEALKFMERDELTRRWRTRCSRGTRSP